jgi:predicted RNA-binding protein with PUA-like domain
MPRYWLLKSDPESFYLEDKHATPGRRTAWDGVRNYQARNLMRDEMSKGDGVLFYHSGGKEPALVGLADVVRAAYPEATDATWVQVDVRARRPFPAPLPLKAIKANPLLGKMALAQRGQRLSVQPVLEGEWQEILRMAGIEPNSL